MPCDGPKKVVCLTWSDVCIDSVSLFWAKTIICTAEMGHQDSELNIELFVLIGSLRIRFKFLLERLKSQQISQLGRTCFLMASSNFTGPISPFAFSNSLQ